MTGIGTPSIHNNIPRPISILLWRFGNQRPNRHRSSHWSAAQCRQTNSPSRERGTCWPAPVMWS